MASAAPPIQPSAEDALEAVQAIDAAREFVQMAVARLDRVPSAFHALLSEVAGVDAITLDTAANLLQLTQRIHAAHLVTR